MKYLTDESLYLALVGGLVKRNSVMTTARRYKKEGKEDQELLYRKAIQKYDIHMKNPDHFVCSFYNKLISDLSLNELESLCEDHLDLFTHLHEYRYGYLVLGSHGQQLHPNTVQEIRKETRD